MAQESVFRTSGYFREVQNPNITPSKFAVFTETDNLLGFRTGSELLSDIGAGDIKQDGNSFGTNVIIGSNDNFGLQFETSGVTKATIESNGKFFLTKNDAPQNAVTDRLVIQTNSSGTTSTSFGSAILFQGETNTTENRDMVRLSTKWNNTTDGSHQADFIISTAVSGTLTQMLRVFGNNVPNLFIGAGNATYSDTGISSSSNYQVTSTGNILTIDSTSNNISHFIRLGNTTYTTTSGNKYGIITQSSYAPTSGNGNFYNLFIDGTINQTNASGITGGILISPTLTSPVDYRAIEIKINHPASYGIYQSGSTTRNYFQGNVGIKTETPQQALEVQGKIRLGDVSGIIATNILGRDSSGDIGEIILGTGLTLQSGILTATGSTSTSPSGTNYNIQFYNNGAFGADSNITVTPGAQPKLAVGTSAPLASLHGKSWNSVGSNILLTEDSAGNDIVSILSNGFVKFGNNEALPRIYQTNIVGGNVSYTAGGLTFQGAIDSVNGNDAFGFIHSTINETTGNYNTIILPSGFTASSGNATFTQIKLNPTINQTGGANGLVRSIFVNPNLTSVSSYRGLELNYNSSSAWGIFQSGATTSNFFEGSIGVGTASINTDAAIEIDSTTKALLLSRMNTTQRDSIGTPTDGLILYNSQTNKFTGRQNSSWVEFATGIVDTLYIADGEINEFRTVTLTGGTLSLYGGNTLFEMDSFAINLQYNNGLDDSLLIIDNGGISLDSTETISLISPLLAINIGSDATGDIYYRGGGGFITRLPISTDGKVLSVTGGLPSWETLNGTVGGTGTTNNIAIWQDSDTLTYLPLGTANQMLGVNDAGTASEYKTFSGVTNQVNISHIAGTVGFSLPQNIHTAAEPTFGKVTLNGSGFSQLNVTVTGSFAAANFINLSGYTYVGMTQSSGGQLTFSAHKAPSTSLTTNNIITFANSYSPSAHAVSQVLGTLQFQGSSGGDVRTGAYISAIAEGTFTASSAPTYLSFWTSPTGTTTPVEHLRITASGTTQLRNGNGLVLYDSNNTNFIQIKPPATASLTQDYVLVLPVDNGAASQVLTTDGEGNLSWTTPSGSIDGSGTANYLAVWQDTDTLTQLAPGTANQVLGRNAANNAYEYKTFSGVTNQVNISHIAGTVGFSLPQDIHTGAEPTFEKLTLTENFPTLTVLSPLSGSAVLGGSYAGTLQLTHDEGVPVVSGDTLGIITYRGKTVSSWSNGGFISAAADGDWSDTSNPTTISFATSAINESSSEIRFRITSSGATEIRSGNELRFYDSDNTNYIVIKAPATGTLTNSYTLTLPSGNGGVNYVLKNDGSGNLSFVDGTSILTNWTEGFSSSTQNTSYWLATNAATNINAGIIPKGTGAFIISIPDGTSTGGNARGSRAVDLQLDRILATNVASGNQSVLIGGGRNSATAADSVIVGGRSNTASGSQSAIVGGATNNVSGLRAAIVGGDSNNVNASYGGAIASLYGQSYLEAQLVHASGRFARAGDAQASEILERITITGTGTTELYLDGVSKQPVVFSGGTAWNANIQGVAICNSVGDGVGIATGDTYCCNISCGVKRLGDTISLVGTPTLISEHYDTSMSSANFDISTDNSTMALKVSFIPPNTARDTTQIRVVATLRLTELSFT